MANIKTYREFVERKLTRVPPTGITGDIPRSPHLFDFQHDLTAWALRRGRAAIFASTGLGKTRMELTFAAHVPGRVLVLTPLAVAAQTIAEGVAIGIDAKHARDQQDACDARIVVANYERLHLFDSSAYTGVVLDESSIIKHHDAKTLRVLLDAFSATPFRLACTATPAPNDFVELGTHAEFLGICSRAEMLAEYFVHDGGSTSDWRLKGHARSLFWKWVSSWAALVRKPDDLGYDASAYELPALNVEQHIVAGDHAQAIAAGNLFAMPAQSLMERRNARRGSLDARVAECAARVNADTESWIVWCDLNAESEALVDAIPGAVEVRGSDTTEEKEQRLADFAAGRVRVLVTKPSIAGFGLNWQHCARMAFVGVTDSWEAYFQAVRRCWRFGQTREVQVHLYASDLEGAVLDNLARKDADAARMADALSAETRDAVRVEIRGQQRVSNSYEPRKVMRVPSWIKTEEECVT